MCGVFFRIFANSENSVSRHTCISCAEESLGMLLIKISPLPLFFIEHWCLGSSWIAQHKKGAASIWWEQIIKCINCVSTSVESHLAYCQGPIRFLWFYVPKIIRSAVNGTEIFAVWFCVCVLFSFRFKSGLSVTCVQSCFLKNVQLKYQSHFWCVFFLFITTVNPAAWAVVTLVCLPMMREDKVWKQHDSFPAPPQKKNLHQVKFNKLHIILQVVDLKKQHFCPLKKTKKTMPRTFGDGLFRLFF